MSKLNIDPNLIDVALRKTNGRDIIVRCVDKSARIKIMNTNYNPRQKTLLNSITASSIGLRGNERIYLNDNLTYDRSALMSIFRKKLHNLNILNNASNPNDRLKAKSNAGKLLVMNTNKEYVHTPTLDDFHKLHPATAEMNIEPFPSQGSRR